MEVFVWLQMGGLVENIDVVPIGDDEGADATYETVKGWFSSFKGEDAQCYVKSDRDRLLGVIEVRTPHNDERQQRRSAR